MEEIIIYALIDPITLKVRYIGRTKCSLRKRLREHMSKSKKYYDRTHKSNWIRSLLQVNQKPFIRKLCIINGWRESHEFERQLINKYKDRLLNHDDRGEGNLFKEVTYEQREQISNSLKKYFKENRNNLSWCKKVYTYSYDGKFISEHPSIKQASIDLSVKRVTIRKSCHNKTKYPKVGRMQFSFTKVESMKDWTKCKRIVAVSDGNI